MKTTKKAIKVVKRNLAEEVNCGLNGGTEEKIVEKNLSLGRHWEVVD